MSAIQELLPEFDREMATTRRLLERVPGDRLTWKPHPKSRSLGELATHVAESRATLAGMGDDRMQGEFTVLKPNGEVFFKIPRRALLRSVLLSHLIHHRGQLTVYLRENDVPLPSIYGPTADEGI